MLTSKPRSWENVERNYIGKPTLFIHKNTIWDGGSTAQIKRFLGLTDWTIEMRLGLKWQTPSKLYSYIIQLHHDVSKNIAHAYSLETLVSDVVAFGQNEAVFPVTKTRR